MIRTKSCLYRIAPLALRVYRKQCQVLKLGSIGACCSVQGHSFGVILNQEKSVARNRMLLRSGYSGMQGVYRKKMWHKNQRCIIARQRSVFIENSATCHNLAPLEPPVKIFPEDFLVKKIILQIRKHPCRIQKRKKSCLGDNSFFNMLKACASLLLN